MMNELNHHIYLFVLSSAFPLELCLGDWLLLLLALVRGVVLADHLWHIMTLSLGLLTIHRHVFCLALCLRHLAALSLKHGLCDWSLDMAAGLLGHL